MKFFLSTVGGTGPFSRGASLKVFFAGSRSGLATQTLWAQKSCSVVGNSGVQLENHGTIPDKLVFKGLLIVDVSSVKLTLNLLVRQSSTCCRQSLLGGFVRDEHANRDTVSE